jgi:hypothetical protein
MIFLLSYQQSLCPNTTLMRTDDSLKTSSSMLLKKCKTLVELLLRNFWACFFIATRHPKVSQMLTALRRECNPWYCSCSWTTTTTPPPTITIRGCQRWWKPHDLSVRTLSALLPSFLFHSFVRYV